MSTSNTPSCPAWTMNGRNQPRVDIAGPGPGQYEVTPSEHGPKYSLTGRNFGDIDSDKVPGPGTYQVTKISAYTCSARSAPAFTIGGRTKMQLVRNNTPGPCDYKTMKSMSKTGFSFGRPSFRTLRQGDDTPGPGEYQTVTTMREAHGPQYSIRGHNNAMKMKKASNMPGPANYYPQLPRARPSFSIGSGLRFRRDGAQNANSPGPSDYDISRSVIAHRTAPSIVIASKPNMKQYGASTPGPAEYSPDVKDSSRKGFSLLGRSREHSGRDQGPGPGAYNVVRDPTKARETPAYSIGARPKGPGSDIAKKYLPGPGSYQPRSNSRSSPKYTLAGRIHNSDNDDSYGPGPGDYISHSVANNAPAFSLGAKLKVTHLM